MLLLDERVVASGPFATISFPVRWCRATSGSFGLERRLVGVGAVWAVAVVVFGVLERLVDPGTFDNVWLAMWWAMQTVTTVGFGDVVPQGTAGRVVAAILMLGGLALFAVVTGVITAVFVARAQAYGHRGGRDPVGEKLDEMSSKLDAIEVELGRVRGRIDPPTD